MRFLLINTNPAVSKLINASLNRIGHEVTEINDYNSLSLDAYIAIIIDSDSYKAEYADDLLSISLSPSLIYLKAQDKDVPQNFQYVLQKPFLPTDFLSFMVSILTKTPELHRFVTAECRQFENIPLAENAAINNNVNFKDIQKENLISSDFENKNPIFDIKESENDMPTYNSSDIFSNLSDEIEKLYDKDESALNEETIVDLDIKENVFESFKHTNETADEKNDANDFDFTLENINNIQNEPAQEPIDTPIIENIAVQNETQQDNLIKNANEKVDFDFDIFDKVGKNTASQNMDTMQDEVVAQNKEETKNETKLDFGFKNLAKEFDDLIQGDEDANDNNSLSCPNEDIQKTDNIKLEHPKYEFENLSEQDMQKALQESGMLPPSKDVEIAKAEIGQIVEQSVKSMLQSQILRDVLKGLKMNITITFEDKD
ncbi:MAG: hypothetical protein LBD84_04845 [Campylobacteraceae bacterium]|jgi:uncharacterized membrane protein|nr:hypothetical protein [Campylobacteraceae bacterium]